jgi:hypothetical protein
MQYEPGEKWKYTQSGINAAARIVEVVSGMTFDAFVQKRIFDPLGMKDTTFYPTEAQRARLATAYARNKDTGALEPVPPRADFGSRNSPPQGNGGLYSTATDYARFCQMLLNGGTLDGRRYLSERAMKLLTTSQTGDMPTGFFQTEAYGNRGANYSWGIATCILRSPHDGVAAMLSPGTYGHGGALGHSGVDRSREGTRLCPDGAALEFSEQRRQRGPPRLPASRRESARDQVSWARPSFRMLYARPRKTIIEGLPTAAKWPVKERPPVPLSTRKTVIASPR